jgi:hypothetical protein
MGGRAALAREVSFMDGSVAATTDAAPDAAERRAHVRWRTPNVNATLRQGDRVLPCRLKDISAGGAGLYPDFTVELGQQVELELSPRCTLPGRIIRNGRDAIGIKFDIPVALERRIDELIGLGLGPTDW